MLVSLSAVKLGIIHTAVLCTIFPILSLFLSAAHPFSTCHIISLTQSNQSVSELPLWRQIKGPSSELLLMIGPHYIIITLSHPLLCAS